MTHDSKSCRKCSPKVTARDKLLWLVRELCRPCHPTELTSHVRQPSERSSLKIISNIQSMPDWLHCLRTSGETEQQAEGCGGAELSWQLGGRGGGREEQKGKWGKEGRMDR